LAPSPPRRAGISQLLRVGPATRGRTIRVNTKIGGSTNVECVVPGPCSWPGPGLTCVVGVPGGVRSSGKSPRTPVPSRTHRRGADWTGELRKPPLMPRDRKPRWMECCSGVQGLVAEKRQAPAEQAPQPGEHRRPRGRGGTHPSRNSCVRNAVTPVGVRAIMPGKPTVRKAQLPGGNRMTKKRTPAAERQRETGTRWLAPPPAVPNNRPDTGPSARTRKRADVVR